MFHNVLRDAGDEARYNYLLAVVLVLERLLETALIVVNSDRVSRHATFYRVNLFLTSFNEHLLLRDSVY